MLYTFLEFTLIKILLLELLSYLRPPELEDDGGVAGQKLDLENKMRSLLHIEQRLRYIRTGYRKSGLCIPRNETERLVPNSYIHVSVSKIGGPIVEIYKSLTDT